MEKLQLKWRDEKLKEKCDLMVQIHNFSQKNIDRSTEILEILSKLYTDDETLISAFFLNIVRDNELAIEEIRQEFSEEIATLITQVIKIDKYSALNNVNESATNTESEKENKETTEDEEAKKTKAEMLRNMLVAIAKDIRVIMVKLADILYQARHLEDIDSKKQHELHAQISDIYAPLSARLGFNFIKSELQNLNLKFTKPKEYEALEKELSKNSVARQTQIETTCTKLENLCKEINIKDVKIYGRVKNISSIYNKLNDKKCSINQIYDLSAVRVICDTVGQCYEIFADISSIYTPIDGRFKDYIARPKSNGYKSLHTTVIAENGEPLEIQIRTKEMHDFAEYGVAAHWLYKEKRSKRNLVEEKLTFIRKLIENPDNYTFEELLESIKTDVYSGEIFVQTPKGKIISLVDGSTPIDFAYSIHGNIGDKCVGAKVNGKMVPLNAILANGDEVEIITNPQSKGPSRDWLKVVRTSLARKQINQFFKREMKDENIKKGKSVIEAFCKTKDIPLHRLLVDKYLNIVFERYSLKDIDEMYASVGYGSLTASQIVSKMHQAYKKDNAIQEKKTIPAKTKKKDSAGAILVDGQPGILCRFANCCRPIPYDKIIGFISHSRGVTVHRIDCSNVFSLDADRLIKVEWGGEKSKSFIARIQIECRNHEGILMIITKKLFEMKIDIQSVNTSVKNKVNGYINLEILVSEPEHLDKIISELKELPNVYDVYRR